MSTTPHEEKAFLKSITEAPQEQKAFRKLMFADFLEERGDPRTDLLRKEVAAAESLGWENVHGILSAQRFFGPLDPKTLEALTKAPFPSKEVLDQCKDHLLVLYPGCSLLELRQQSSLQGHRNFSEQHWYDNEFFARTAGYPGYLLIPCEPFPDLFNNTFADQQALLASHHPDYRLMTAAELSCALLLHAHDSRQPLLPTNFLRCSDKDSDGDRVHVGDFDSDGFHVYYDWDDDRSGNLGLAACRKF